MNVQKNVLESSGQLVVKTLCNPFQGDCMSLSMRALAAMNRVEYAEQMVGAGRDDMQTSTMKGK